MPPAVAAGQEIVADRSVTALRSAGRARPAPGRRRGTQDDVVSEYGGSVWRPLPLVIGDRRRWCTSSTVGAAADGVKPA